MKIPKNIELYIIAIVFILVLVNVIWTFKLSSDIQSFGLIKKSPSAKALEIKKGAAKVDLYVMSQCPYGVQAENLLKPVIDKLGGNAYVNVEFIANDAGSGQFNSLHGQPEVQGDIIQLCAKKYYPETESTSYFNFIACQNNNNPRDLVSSIDKCAEENDMDADKIKECFNGEEGKQLMKASIAASNKVGATGSPTIYVNGQPYNGQRSSQAFLSEVCKGLGNIAECQGAVSEPTTAAVSEGGCG